MRITSVDVEFADQPRAQPHRDALQTLSGGGSVTVTVTADDGLVGRSQTGFGRVAGAAETLATLVRRTLAPQVVGREVDEIGAMVAAMETEVEYYGADGLATFGISAVDTALWDLLGRAHGVPCYRLWAPYRRRLPAYATVGWLEQDLDGVRRSCADAVAQGFRGVKIKVGTPTLEEDVRRVEAARSEIGAGVALMVDANQVHTLPEAQRRGEAFCALGVAWYEEPLPKDDVEGYAELCRALTIPVATGENLYGLRSFAAFFERHACDVVQPDLRRGGGPTRLRAVAALAAAHGIPYASHGGGPAALSVLMAAPTAIWLESGPRRADAYPRMEDGYALAPEGPGFGWA